MPVPIEKLIEAIETPYETRLLEMLRAHPELAFSETELIAMECWVSDAAARVLRAIATGMGIPNELAQSLRGMAARGLIHTRLVDGEPYYSASPLT